MDAWIYKLQNYSKQVFTQEEAIDLAAVAVKMVAKKENVDTMYAISCGPQDVVITKQISDYLKAESISLILLNNVLYNHETMEQLSNVKSVVLVEKAGEVLYEEISKELELLNRQGIKVLGAIIVE